MAIRSLVSFMEKADKNKLFISFKPLRFILLETYNGEIERNTLGFNTTFQWLSISLAINNKSFIQPFNRKSFKTA
jgi:hypothetical protein